MVDSGAMFELCWARCCIEVLTSEVLASGYESEFFRAAMNGQQVKEFGTDISIHTPCWARASAAESNPSKYPRARTLHDHCLTA